MRIRNAFLILLLAIASSNLSGRLIESWTYQKMADASDLIAIAKPIATVDTTERGKLPGGPNWEIVGQATDFDVRVVLKGDAKVKRFQLHHYRQKDPRVILDDGPNFVRFDPRDKQAYLLFLRTETNAIYAPVTGQIDPAMYSVIRLECWAK